MRPEPPKFFWPDTDGCWACKNKHGCSGCKFLKRYIAEDKGRNKKKVKARLKEELDF